MHVEMVSSTSDSPIFVVDTVVFILIQNSEGKLC
jgi:hypothetical protein